MVFIRGLPMKINKLKSLFNPSMCSFIPSLVEQGHNGVFEKSDLKIFLFIFPFTENVSIL